MKRMIAFDLDGTLAESKQPLEPNTAALLAGLLEVAEVTVISGGDWPQFEKQVVAQLPAHAKLENLFIMPTTGAKLFRWNSAQGWHSVYDESFSPEERNKIVAALEEASKAAGLADDKSWGEKIEDRGAQVTYSGLGQEAPLAAKKAWDPDFSKRKALQRAVQEKLPDLSIKIGGSTSIDITRQGIDKAYGMRRLCEQAGIKDSDILFMGDAIYPGGNDDPVREAGIDTIQVRDMAETRTAITAVICCLKQPG